MDQPAVIFMHVPKAAGTTLHRIIEQNYLGKQLYFTHPTASTPNGSLAAFKELPLERRAQIRMLHGHLPFGLHAYLPGPATYFTLLREPIDRVVSYYYFVRQDTTHHLHAYATARNMSLRRFIEERPLASTDNFQVRMASGGFHQVGYGQCTPELLATAKQNLLDYFAVVGLAEQFDATLLMLKRAFHWRNIFYVRHNVTADRPTLQTVEPETIDLIRQHNQFDIELYQFAMDRFKLQFNQAGADYRSELATFQATNRRLQPALRLYWRARRYSVRAFIQKIRTSRS